MLMVLGSTNTMSCDFVVQIFAQKQSGLIVKTAGTLAECGHLIRSETDVSLVILDASLTELNGLFGLKQFRQRTDDDIPIVVMGPPISASQIRDYLTIGLAGYLPHTMSADAIISALNLIAAGEKYVPTNVITNESSRMNTTMLTGREKEVLDGLLAGRSNKEIASSLSLSEVTIKHHLKGLRSKLGARNRTHAVCRAIELGMG